MDAAIDDQSVQVFDKNNDGHISAAELKHVMSESVVPYCPSFGLARLRGCIYPLLFPTLSRTR